MTLCRALPRHGATMSDRIDPEVIRQCQTLAGAGVLTPPAACALAYRVHHGRWPWSPHDSGVLGALMLFDLHDAGLITMGQPNLPAIRAAVAVAEAVGHE